jgi:Ala-tRNA(Pro) deacylase
MMTTTVSCKDRLQAYLRAHGVCFTLRHHPRAFTAQEVAASEHVPEDEVTKPVIVFADGRMVMLLVAASQMVQMSKVAPAVGARVSHFADESALETVFTDCEPGALPPFGNLYGLDVYVDRRLAEDDQIEFRAGTHTETMRIAFAEFARLVQPRIVDIAHHR